MFGVFCQYRVSPFKMAKHYFSCNMKSSAEYRHFLKTTVLGSGGPQNGYFHKNLKIDFCAITSLAQSYKNYNIRDKVEK